MIPLRSFTVGMVFFWWEMYGFIKYRQFLYSFFTFLQISLYEIFLYIFAEAPKCLSCKLIFIGLTTHIKHIKSIFSECPGYYPTSSVNFFHVRCLSLPLLQSYPWPIGSLTNAFPQIFFGWLSLGRVTNVPYSVCDTFVTFDCINQFIWFLVALVLPDII